MKLNFWGWNKCCYAYDCNQFQRDSFVCTQDNGSSCGIHRHRKQIDNMATQDRQALEEWRRKHVPQTQ